MSRKSGKGIDKRRRYMSYADKVFIDMCRDIIDNGTSTEGEKVRPVWKTERLHIRSNDSAL